MKIAEILKQYWGYNSFRPMQDKIIQSVMDIKDTLALLPTGGGKSICFQVPAIAIDGICIVVSPLISLMRDQVDRLQKQGIKAAAIYSGMSRREIDIILDNCIYGDFKFIYVSPERLKTQIFIERAKQMNVCLLAIDEAHCISQWGYDFRPTYLEIADFKKKIAVSRIIALTATATKEVKKDIAEKLEMKEVQIFQKSFARVNLSYSAFRLNNKAQKLLEILQNVSGTSLVYVRNRKRTKEIADLLNRNYVSADYYHAGLSAKDRSSKQSRWINNQVRVIVATNAFGMGIDKPDVRTVIHMDLPDSLEAYYQEAGRAGRDEKKAYAVALFNSQDIDELKDRTNRLTISSDQLKRTYQALANYFKIAIGSHEFSSFPFIYEQFITTYNLPIIDTYAALKKLNDEGLIHLTERFYIQSQIIFLLNKYETYRFQVSNPKLDPLIKALLRLYGGAVFADYTKIKEKDIGLLLKTDIEQIRKWLKFLQRSKIIDYQAPLDAPTITFLTPRLHPEKLPIDKAQIEWRKKRAKEKAEAVIDYVATNECRTQIFQHYFDEKTPLTCGICDNDLETRKRLKANEIPLEKVEEVLEAPRNLTELRALMASYTQDQIMEALRILIEDKKVVENGGRFSLI